MRLSQLGEGIDDILDLATPLDQMKEEWGWLEASHFTQFVALKSLPSTLTRFASIPPPLAPRTPHQSGQVLPESVHIYPVSPGGSLHHQAGCLLGSLVCCRPSLLCH